jgi:glyoxylase-like metal-dependent hydrolase (beta-lactamase superfamily II)
MMVSTMFFKQIKYRGDNFSYVIADEDTKESAVVDPSYNVDAISLLVRDQNLTVKYVIDTHSHGDHTAGNEDIRSAFGAKIVAHKLSKARKDIAVVDGEVLKLGRVMIKVVHTPGHSPDGICLLVDGKVLTGDTLFVGECGRTDLAGGSAEDMYHSLFDKLAKLDDKTEVYPGHDYGPKPQSTIGEEKRTNYVLEKRTLDEFVKFMAQP